MTDDRAMRDAIERDEQWLADLCDASDPIDRAAIKRRVRVEMGERWLAQQLHDADGGDVARGVRDGVRSAIQAERVRRSPHGALRFVLAIGGPVGIAAALAFFWVLPKSAILPSGQTTIEAGYADAFEAYTQDDFDTSLTELSDDLDRLVADGTLFEWESDFRGDWLGLEDAAVDDG